MPGARCRGRGAGGEVPAGGRADAPPSHRGNCRQRPEMRAATVVNRSYDCDRRIRGGGGEEERMGGRRRKVRLVRGQPTS